MVVGGTGLVLVLLGADPDRRVRRAKTRERPSANGGLGSPYIMQGHHADGGTMCQSWLLVGSPDVDEATV